MNWLGAGLLSFLAAVCGAVLGALAHVGLRGHGVDLPPVVGLLAGLVVALASGEKSGMRGVLVASFSIWAGASAEVLASPGQGFISGLARFHEGLGPLRALAFLGCAALGLLLGSRGYATLGRQGWTTHR